MTGRHDAMPPSRDRERALHTSAGDFPLREYRLRLAGREWSVLHTDAVFSREDETHFLGSGQRQRPYGVVLWPAAIALAHDVASRAEAFRDARVLELGAGTGLPGIVAASFGGCVVQTDRNALAMSVCRRNGARNGLATTIEHRLADWSTWDDERRYDWIIGSDILYAQRMHDHVRRILATNLAPEGRALIADPFRSMSLPLLEAMEADGWTITLTKWRVGADKAPRSIGVYELTRPG
jgi:methyltransferase-like protein 23